MRQPLQVLVLPFRWIKSEIQFLALKRSDDGRWQGVAGGVEANETVEQAAIRELAEETGFEVESLILLDTRASIPKCVFSDHAQWSEDQYVVTEFAFGAEVEDEPKLSYEHTDFRWGSADQIRELVHYDSNRTAIWELHERVASGSDA